MISHYTEPTYLTATLTVDAECLPHTRAVPTVKVRARIAYTDDGFLGVEEYDQVVIDDDNGPRKADDEELPDEVDRAIVAAARRIGTR